MPAHMGGVGSRPVREVRVVLWHRERVHVCSQSYTLDTACIYDFRACSLDINDKSSYSRNSHIFLAYPKGYQCVINECMSVELLERSLSILMNGVSDLNKSVQVAPDLLHHPLMLILL